MLVKDPNYGHLESNGLTNGAQYHSAYNEAETVDWRDKRLAKITRLRLLGDYGFPMWDVSYCHGILKDGSPANVELPFHQIPRRGFKRFIIAQAKRDKVYAKGLGLLDEINYSKLL